LHKAPVKNKLPSDFLQTMFREKRLYGDEPDRLPHHPSEEKISYYHKVNNHLRRRLREATRELDPEKRQQRADLLYRLIDVNLARVLHERNPEKWPDPHRRFTSRVPKNKAECTVPIRYFPGIGTLPMAEPALTRTG